MWIVLSTQVTNFKKRSDFLAHGVFVIYENGDDWRRQ